MSEFLNVLDDISSYLKYIKSSGINGFECPEETSKLLKNFDKIILKKEQPASEKKENFIETCPDCNIPYNFKEGYGDTNADIVFVCDSPDDLLDNESEVYGLFIKMLKAIDISAEDIYITNLIKCTVPDHILPSENEYDQCLRNFEKELFTISPKIICILGSSATRVLLKKKGSVSEIRGNFIEFGKSTVFPTFHPSFLLRNPGYKKEAWNDLKKLKNKLSEN